MVCLCLGGPGAASADTATPESAGRDAHAQAGIEAAAVGDYVTAIGHFKLASGSDEFNAKIAFNRAVCLFELHRFLEAQRVFAGVAFSAGGALAVLSALNAGFAAVELGDYAAGRRYLLLSRQLHGGAGLVGEAEELASELRLAARGMVERAGSLRGGDEDSAIALMVRALGVAPNSALIHYDAGVLAFEMGRYSRSRTWLQTALDLGLDDELSQAARDYRSLGASGMNRIGGGLFFSSTATIGVDSNATQLGLGGSNARVSLGGADEGGGFNEFELDVGLSDTSWGSGFVLIKYRGTLRAYWRSSLDRYSIHAHGLSLTGEWEVGPGLRLSIQPEADLAAFGLHPVELSTASLGGRAGVGADYADGLETHLRGYVARVESVGDGYGFLTGTALGLKVTQGYRQPRYRLSATIGFRAEGRGVQIIDVTSFDVCIACKQWLRIPLAYDGPTLEFLGDAKMPLGLEGAMRFAVDWRFHREPTGIAVTSATGRTFEGTVRTQRDTRLTIAGTISREFWEVVDVGLGYELVVGTSNIDNTAGGDHTRDYANLNFTRHQLSLSLGFSM